MPEETSVRLEIRNHKVEEELKRIISSMDGFHLQDFDDQGPCDLLILEFGDDLEKELQGLYSIMASGSTGNVFLVTSSFDPRALIEAKRAGVKKLFSHPVKKEEIKNALWELKESKREASPVEERQEKGNILYLLGCKGGVGTTTVAVNLAASLAELDRSLSVALTDMTLPFGGIPIFLNVQTLPDWHEVARVISHVNPILLQNILLRHPSGIFLLPCLSGPDGLHAADPEVVERLLSVIRKHFDFIVVDGGRFLVQTSHKILEACDTILVVTVLNNPCLVNVKRVLSIFNKLGYSRDGKTKIVINRYDSHCSLSLKEVEQKIGQEVFWKIPNDFRTTMTAIDRGEVLSVVGDGKEICKSFEELAACFLG